METTLAVDHKLFGEERHWILPVGVLKISEVHRVPERSNRWNALPSSIVNCNDIRTFKLSCKEFLYCYV